MNADDTTLYDELSLVEDNLNKATQRFDFSSFPQYLHPVRIINSLNQLRYKYSAPVVAANQVGYNFQVLSVAGMETGMFNPVITFHSEKKVVMEEASVSYPNLIVKIKRPETIRVRYLDCNGEPQINIFSGMTARFIQHGIDQLNGVCFAEKADRFHREQAYRKQKKARKKTNGR